MGHILDVVVVAVRFSRIETHLPNEILIKIFSYHALPSAAIIGRNRYETLNIPKGPLVESAIKNYTDNRLGTGACTHDHENLKAQLRTLSALSKASHRFHRLTLPLLYRTYPGQTVVKPQLFLRSISQKIELAGLVRELVVDPWDDINSPKTIAENVSQLGLGYPLVDFLHQQASTWNDESHVLLLMIHCFSIETMDFTCPAAYKAEGGVVALCHLLRHRGPNTLARSNIEAKKWSEMVIDLPLRRLRTLHLHHAEHMYIRSLDNIVALLRLPTISSLTVYRFHQEATALNGLSHIRDLTIWRCSFSSKSLLTALRTYCQLTSLSIIFAGFKAALGRLVPEDVPIDWQKLGNIIRTRLQNLRSLRLDDRELSPPQPRPFGPLKGLRFLEELAINEGCLDRGPFSRIYIKEGLVYDIDAMEHQAVELADGDMLQFPRLTEIHLDQPENFRHDLGVSGWSCERVVGDQVLWRPTIVTDSLMPPEEKEVWEQSQNERAKKSSVLLRRIS
ncbi:putative leucine-rich repeat domain superfamily [Septoria linicola]|nr:putative leucine-rich repeat domain superfamily [Septoria linicola]